MRLPTFSTKSSCLACARPMVRSSSMSSDFFSGVQPLIPLPLLSLTVEDEVDLIGEGLDRLGDLVRDGDPIIELGLGAEESEVPRSRLTIFAGRMGRQRRRWRGTIRRDRGLLATK
jgi:hypothetical protein